MSLTAIPVLVGLLGRAEKGYRLQAPLSCRRQFRPSIGGYSCTGKRKREEACPPKLLEKTVKAANGQTKVLVADSQYSSRKLRRRIYSHGIKPVIPYPSNQKPAEAEFLHVDKRFKAHRSENALRP